MKRSGMAVPSTALLGQIVHGDCVAVMNTIPDDCIDLIVTSPPYFNARKYSRWETYDAYLAWCGTWIADCLRVLAPGRMLCVNASPVIVARSSRGSRSQRFNIPADLHGIVQGLGAWFAEDLTWEKPEGAAINRNQRFSLDRHPMQWRANGTTERIMVWQKPTKKLNDHIIRSKDKSHRITGDYDRGEVWRMNPERVKGHPAAYPVALPAKLIRYYTWPGDIVLDSFAGSGTTCLAASHAGRRYIGIDANEKFCRVARRRVSSPNMSIDKENQ